MNRHDKKISIVIKDLLDLSEAFFGDDPRWPFIRKLFLRQLNNLKRDISSAKKHEIDF